MEDYIYKYIETRLKEKTDLREVRANNIGLSPIIIKGESEIH